MLELDRPSDIHAAAADWASEWFDVSPIVAPSQYSESPSPVGYLEDLCHTSNLQSIYRPKTDENIEKVDSRGC